MARKPKNNRARAAGGANPSGAAAERPSPTGGETPGFNLKRHRKRSEKAWTDRESWQQLYEDCYDFAIPFRRPAARIGKGVQKVDRLFDNTAMVSTFRGAGQLHQDLFPPGQPLFKLTPGPVAKIAMGGDAGELAKELEAISGVVNAFFLTGEWDMAVGEMCVDLFAGTGYLLPLEGDDARPVRFACIPMDEAAVDMGPYGTIGAIYWRTKMSRRAIKEAFPKGTFPEDFEKKLEEGGEDEVELNQDFVFDAKAKRWTFAAWMKDCEAPIATETYRTQPAAVGRYYRVPGEAYGRGPIMLALPTIKTLNKAMELTLKSAAIQMLGIWGYRPGGAFNPDTARLAPGAFWPMGSTGGVMGADVQRLDPAAGRIDVSSMINQELRDQTRQALHDDRLPERGDTPPSATEILARMRRIAENYIGAFGRLIHEIVPVVVKRVIEILHKRKLIETNIDIDELLIRLEVQSPIATALKMDAMTKILEFIEIVAAIKGPEGVELLVKVDKALDRVGREMGVPADLLLTDEEREQLKAQLAEAAAAMAQAQMAAQGGAQEAAAPAPAAA